jgi:hypothetical protein
VPPAFAENQQGHLEGPIRCSSSHANNVAWRVDTRQVFKLFRLTHEQIGEVAILPYIDE